MNYYPFHIGDYVSATRHLSWEEDAAFRRLLDTYYVTEKPIPADHRAACRLVMAQTDSQREAVRVVLEEFFVLTADGWINKRADAEIEVMRDKQQKQRDKANKRWHKPEAEPGIATVLKTDAAASKTDADAMPPTPVPTPTPVPKEKTEREQRASRLPADWVLPVEWEEWATQERPDLDATITACKFRDYWAGIAGSKGRKLDWLATWRNWVREERSAPGKVVGFGPPAEPAWRTEQRARNEAFLGPAAASRRPQPQRFEVIDADAKALG